MDLVSVIIPFFKKKNFIDQSISSVLNQSYSNIEIIIVYDDEEKSDLEYLRKIYNSNKKIKIIVNEKNIGAGFSRNKGFLNNQSLLMAKHLGIYSYRASFIKKFVNWDQTKNEVLENLEQLRALENNTSIGAIKALSVDSIGIDTKEDLIKARSMMLDE